MIWNLQTKMTKSSKKDAVCVGLLGFYLESPDKYMKTFGNLKYLLYICFLV